MKIIKLTKQEWKTIDPTKTGASNMNLVKEYPILFNTSEMITAKESHLGGTYITHKAALIDAFTCKEKFEDVCKLLNI